MGDRRSARVGEALDQVRQREDRTDGLGLSVVRIKIRCDFYVDLGELDFSFIAWEHPGAILLRNEIWSHYDQLHIGMAALDMTSLVYETIKQIPDPFP